MDNMQNKQGENMDIAIIGISARFSKADNVSEFWTNLKYGRDCVTECPAERKRDIEEYLDYMEIAPENRVYRQAAFLDEIDKFDYEFFRIPPKEAKIMDPNQRLLLEVSYNAIEDSGYSVEDFDDKKIGIFTGCPTEYTCKAYQNLIMDISPELANDSFSGNLPAMIPARLSYYLNFHGPAILIDTSCSSSLSALHMACISIKNKDCDLAIASGINVFTLPISNQVVNSIGIVASDGRAKTFDDACDGVGQGEGVGAILLKPLAEAICDKDNIYAVIKASAINQDGKSLGITAPNASAQEMVIVEAWERAEINPETISYIETHGTATKLGDPTEISGINRAFRRYTSKKQFCGVGSVKTNIGHTLGAAGMASIIKVALALKNKQLPASIHFEKPNSRIDFVNSSVYVNNRLAMWDEEYPRRCGVSSFGISGTNCHVVLEEAPNDDKRTDYLYEDLIFTISAASVESLKNLVSNYISFLEYENNIDLYNFCYTVNVGRKDLKYRIAIITSSLPMLKDKLKMIKDIMFLENAVNDDEKICSLINEGIWISSFIENEKWTLSQTGVNDELVLKGMQYYIDNAFENIDCMRRLCYSYVLGENIPWKGLYKRREGYRLSIPVYPFKRSRCWFDVPKRNKEILSSANIFYRPKWGKCENQQPLIQFDSNSTCVIISSNNDFIFEMLKKTQERFTKVILIEYSNHFERLDENHYLIEDDVEHYEKVFRELEHRNITHVIYNCFSNEIKNLKHSDTIQETLNNGIYRFYNLIKVLPDIVTKKIEVCIITENTYVISDKEEVLNPGFATLVGLAKTINWEISSLHCRCIDVDSTSTIENIVDEISTCSSEFIVGYRDNTRYVERIEQIKWDDIENHNFNIKQHGTYLLIGGLGRIGRRLCSLFKGKDVNIVIISRSSFLEHESWEKMYEETSDDNLRNQLEYFMEIERSGARLYFYSCDISDYRNTKMILEQIRNEVGPINGLVQLAVDDCGKYIKDQSIDELKKSIKPKIYGTTIIDELTEKDNLDFFVTFSSVMTLVSGKKNSSYVISNSFLEAFSEYRNHSNRISQVICWPEWLDIGLDERLMNNEDTSLFMKLPLQSGLNAFWFLLFKKIDRVIVGQINYESKIYSLMDILPFMFTDNIKLMIQGKNANKESVKKKIKYTQNIKLQGRKTGIYSETEHQLAEAYYSILGYDTIDITTNFFELGGDSISAVRICVELEKYNLILSPNDIMKYQTIQCLAESVSKINEFKGV